MTDALLGLFWFAFVTHTACEWVELFCGGDRHD